MAYGFDFALRLRVEAEDFSATSEAIARRCKVTERQVFLWRNGRKPLPVWALLCMPVWLADSVIEDVRSRLHKGDPLHPLRAAIQWLEDRGVSESERDALSELHHQLGKVLFGEGRR